MTQNEWTDWLARIGYGIDFATEAPPPCTRLELAEAYQRADPHALTTVDEWAWCIEQETSATFRGDA